MSVYWEPATVGEENGASTRRAHFVARERSAVGLAMNSLTTTIAKVSQTLPVRLCCIRFLAVKSMFKDNYPVISLSRYR